MRVVAGAGVTTSAVLLGAGVGVLALLVHRLEAAGVPWGLALAVLASAGGSVGLRGVGAGRAGSAGYGIGWCAVVLAALAGRPEGDFVLAGDALGWCFLGVGGGSVVISTGLGLAAWPTENPAPRP